MLSPGISTLSTSRARRVATRANLILLATLACSRGESKPVDDGAAGAGRSTARGGPAGRTAEPLPRDLVLPPVAPPGVAAYAPRAVVAAGTVSGTVELAGEPPADTTVRVTVDSARCGAQLVDRAVDRRGARVGGAVVWLGGLRAGKPLPVVRRFELGLANCLLAPRAQPVLAGGTLNVKSGDAMRSRLRFVRRPSGEVTSLVTMNDAGQVVPDERVLNSAGVIEVRGELHPWLRAWLLVFDHPYYAATDADGAFALPDVPPGSYTLYAWHERLGLAEQAVTVGAGGTTAVTLRLGRAGVGPASR